jgi:hypothetical protein
MKVTFVNYDNSIKEYECGYMQFNNVLDRNNFNTRTTVMLDAEVVNCAKIVIIRVVQSGYPDQYYYNANLLDLKLSAEDCLRIHDTGNA